MAVVRGPRFLPYEVWRSSQRSPESLAGFGGATLWQEGEWEGRKGKRREGKKREERAGQGVEGSLRLRIPGSIFYLSPPLPIIVN